MNHLESHLPMVHRIARSLSRRLPPADRLDDLVAAGSLGLVEAAARFDEHRGVGFEAFALLRVRGAMLDSLRADCAGSRESRRRGRRIESRRRELAAKLGREPDEDELIEALGPSGKKVGEIAPRLVSLDEMEGGGDRERLEYRLSEQETSALETLAAEEGKRRVEQALGRLGDRARTVLSLYYYEELTLREIGEILGVTESRVCQLRGRAIEALREMISHSD